MKTSTIIAVVSIIALACFTGSVLWLHGLCDTTVKTTDIKTTDHNETIQLSDEEYLRVGINNYFLSDFDNPYFPRPDYDVVLEDIAFNNAKSGTGLFTAISENTAEEALGTFLSVDRQHSCWQASFWLDTNQLDNPGSRYAIGIYKTSYNQYNVSVVIRKSKPDTQELNRNGAYVTVHHDPVTYNFSACNYGTI